MSAVKAVTTLILAAILGVGPVCGETRAAPPDQLRRQVLSVPRLTSPIVIDGDVADWPKGASLRGHGTGPRDGRVPGYRPRGLG